MGKLKTVVQLGVKKFFAKPVKIDALLKAVADFLGTELEIDTTPCIIEARFNDDILFIEVARGLNGEKIELLKYKIAELLNLYGIENPKVLIMMSGIDISESDHEKMKELLSNIIEHGKTSPRYVKILTGSESVKKFIRRDPEFARIEVTDSLEHAMDGLLGIKSGQLGQETAQEKLISAANVEGEQEESIHMGFQAETIDSLSTKLGSMQKKMQIAIVDDDIVIHELVKTVFSDTGWDINAYENGKRFVESDARDSYDLVFLDLMMPEMNGFQVLEFFKKNKVGIPVIVLSALSQKETVLKALAYGVKSYMIKPLKVDTILKKSTEILQMNF